MEITVPWTHHSSTFSMLCLGNFDPTVRRGPAGLVAVLEGSVITLRWATRDGSTTYTATFDGDPPSWPETFVKRLVGWDHLPLEPSPEHLAATRSAARHRNLRIAGNGLVFTECVKAVLGQRITGHDAALQWSRLVHVTAEPIASYADLGLFALPDPEAVTRLTTVQFHRLGIEERRGRTIRQLADLAQRGHLVGVDSTHALADRTRHLTGFGRWSLAVAGGNAFGDSDALPVGDFHLKNTVSWALTGKPRGTDDEMLALLSPFAGWRWWITRCLSLDYRSPRYDHRRPNPDIRTM